MFEDELFPQVKLGEQVGGQEELGPEDLSGEDGNKLVQHVFHSGWKTGKDGVFDNVQGLRENMTKEGVFTTPDQWTVFSDPRKWQVLKEKFTRIGKKPPTAKLAGKLMAQNTLSKTPTVWHGHSQGGAQITQSGKYALKEMMRDEGIQSKVLEKLEGMTDEERVEMLQGELGRKRTHNYHEEKHQELLLEHLTKQKCEKKLSKYNAFSYSGSAMYPPEWAEHATFSHMRGDPVSGHVVGLGKGGWHEDGDEHRHMERMEKDPQNREEQIKDQLQVNIGRHKYDTNYSEQDGKHTQLMLENMGLMPEEDEMDGGVEDLEELDREETPGLRTGDDTKTLKALGDGLGRGLDIVEDKTKKGAKKVGKGLVKGGKVVGKGVKTGAKGVGKGMKVVGKGIGTGLVETSKNLMPMMGLFGGMF